MQHAKDTTADLSADRRDRRDRRIRLDRRKPKDPEYKAPERREAPLERRTVERRRQIDPTTCERDYQPDEVEFMKAMDDYKRRSGRMFPTWSEVLEVIRDLGYRKVATPTQTYEAMPVLAQ
jgi:hypothetical protein